MPKITALPIANSAATGDLLVLDQSNVTKRIDFNVLQSAIANAGTVGSLISAGAALGSFIQSGAGAVSRTVQGKERDIVSAKDDGATGDGVTNDRAAFLSVQTDFPTTLIHVPAGTYLFFTAATLSGNFLFYAGAKLKPANGVTITVTGSIQSGAYQIFDTSAGGHVNTTSAKVDFAYAEWWGVSGGDSSFNSSNAASNKPLIDEVITYGPYEVHFRTAGIYSTTGHIVDSSHPHMFVGLGKALGSGNAVINGIVGSGIAFSDAANMGADLQASILFVFQNGAAGSNNLPVRFRDIAVGVSNTSTVGAVLVGFSTIATLGYLWTADNSAFVGYVAWHWGYCNIAEMNNCDLIGNFAAESESVATAAVGAAGGVVHKISYVSCRMSQTQNVSGQIVYQNNPATDNCMFCINHIGCDFEFGFNGFVLAAQNQTFVGCHMEQISGVLASGESASRQSTWINPNAAGGNLISDLQSKLGPNSVVLQQNSFYLGTNGGQVLGNIFDASGTITVGGTACSQIDLGRSGKAVRFLGTLRPTSPGGYLASDASAGITASFTSTTMGGKTLTIKDGIITGFA